MFCVAFIGGMRLIQLRFNLVDFVSGELVDSGGFEFVLWGRLQQLRLRTRRRLSCSETLSIISVLSLRGTLGFIYKLAEFVVLKIIRRTICLCALFDRCVSSR